MSETNSFFNSFEQVNKTDWLEKATKELKDKSSEALIWKINNQLKIKSFYHPSESQFEQAIQIPESRNNNNWEILLPVSVGKENNTALNDHILEALKQGVNALLIVADSEISDFDTLLKNVNPAFISIHIELNCVDCWEKTMSNFKDWAKDIDPSKLKGTLINSQLENLQEYEKLISWTHQNLPSFKVLGFGTRKKEDPAEDLFQLIQQAVNQLDHLEQAGHSPSAIAQQIFFNLQIGTSYFLEIARLKALRILWSNILDAWDKDISKELFVKARINTESWTDDIHKNMIQATTQTMAAAIGGANCIDVVSTDLSDIPAPYTMRIARNVHHILKMESFLDQVVDPSKGSYYIDELTRQLVNEVWKRLS